jgi:hypothetical protein
MHRSRADADLGTSFLALRRPLQCGQGRCVSHKNDAAREEDLHLGRGGRRRCADLCRRTHGLVGIVGWQGSDGRHSCLGGGELPGGRRWRLGGGRGIGTLGLVLILSLVGRSVLQDLPLCTTITQHNKQETYCTIGPTGQNFLALWLEVLVSGTFGRPRSKVSLVLIPCNTTLQGELASRWDSLLQSLRYLKLLFEKHTDDHQGNSVLASKLCLGIKFHQGNSVLASKSLRLTLERSPFQLVQSSNLHAMT